MLVTLEMERRASVSLEVVKDAVMAIIREDSHPYDSQHHDVQSLERSIRSASNPRSLFKLFQ
jgi:hypothetical protein